MTYPNPFSQIETEISALIFVMLMIKAGLDRNTIPRRLEIYPHPLGSVLNSLQALRPGLAQCSRAMQGCYLRISQSTHRSDLQPELTALVLNTTAASIVLFLPTEDEGMIEGGMEGGKREGSILSGLLWHVIFFFFSYPAGHLFPVCNMTPASDWVLLLWRCVLLEAL